MKLDAHYGMLPMGAFEHCGDRRIRLHGGGGFIGDIVSSVADPVVSMLKANPGVEFVGGAGSGLLDTVGNAIQSVGDVVGDTAKSVGDTVHDVGSSINNAVKDNIPGGWVTVGALAAGAGAAGAFDGLGAAAGDAAAGDAAAGEALSGIDLGGVGASPASWTGAGADVADALAADNIDVGGGFNPATGAGDAATAAAAAETGVTSSAGTAYGIPTGGLGALTNLINGGSSTSGTSGLTGAGALAGLGGLAGALSIINADKGKYGVPGRQEYAGPLSKFKYNPATFTPTTVDPNQFKPQGAPTATVGYGMPVQASMGVPQQGGAGLSTLFPTAQDTVPSAPQVQNAVQLATSPAAQPAQISPVRQSMADWFANQKANIAANSLANQRAAYGAADPAFAAHAAAVRNAATHGTAGSNFATGGTVAFAHGGLGDLGSYSDGGRMLKGPGDGMSDSIPASIAGKRPARLADSEFVIPADVVSHLGNGSSDAGAKVLYKMMDRIRQARTGTKKQGKQINPDKMLPK